jgi:hypothetical protein
MEVGAFKNAPSMETSSCKLVESSFFHATSRAFIDINLTVRSLQPIHNKELFSVKDMHKGTTYRGLEIVICTLPDGRFQTQVVDDPKDANVEPLSLKQIIKTCSG